MYQNWRDNIHRSQEVIRENAGPRIVVPVAGSLGDARYWSSRFQKTSREVFNADGKTKVIGVAEEVSKGNFLGTLNAWYEVRSALGRSKGYLNDIMLISMVVGKGTRLSPFTQALGNRKPAFPTPKRLMNGSGNLCICEVANSCMNVCVSYLRACGFRGILIKWGDEILVSGIRWQNADAVYSKVDAVRFFGSTEPNPELGRQKEWLIADSQSGVLKKELSRQEYSTLVNRLQTIASNKSRVGVNLGSFAISYDLLDALFEVFREDIPHPDRAADWDPYFWIAFLCEGPEEWERERELELQTGRTGIADLEGRYPDFFWKVWQARQCAERRLKRAVKVVVLDFGKVFWVDMGLHITLREHFQSLLSDDDVGQTSRELHGIPHWKDSRGNIVVRSKVTISATIRNSVIVDAIISSGESVIDRGVIIGGHYGLLSMPVGGVVLFSAVKTLNFQGPNGIAFKSVGGELFIGEGDRHTTLALPEGKEDLMANEAMEDFSGRNYAEPIMGNTLSFKEAGKRMASLDVENMKKLWKMIAQKTRY